eukprot:jgi/Hompol1/1013/HPOL_002630-RA
MVRQSATVVAIFVLLGIRVRLLQQAWTVLTRASQDPSVTSRFGRQIDRLAETTQSLERSLYPFLPPNTTTQTLLARLSGRGIVMTTGNEDVRYAIISIKQIRSLGSKLPIQLFYAGETDLQPSHRNTLQSLPNTTVIDLATYFDLATLDITSYAIKPFAILASTFAETLFMDADALFLKNPDTLFESLSNLSPARFFRDRTLKSYMHLGPGMVKLLKDLMGDGGLSATAQESRLVRGISVHEQEAGVMLMDRRVTLPALLLACLLNAKPLRDYVWQQMHGDKETFWLSHETLGIPYEWFTGVGTAIGYLDPKRGVCGSLLHTGSDQQPLWFNGGLQRNKDHNNGGQDLFDMTHYALDAINDEERYSQGDIVNKEGDRRFKIASIHLHLGL